MLAQTKFDPDMDYDDLGEVFSLASGFKVWCERHGNTVNIMTDGDKDEVSQRIMDKASTIIDKMLEDAVMEMVAFEMSGMRQWEKNARLN